MRLVDAAKQLKKYNNRTLPASINAWSRPLPLIIFPSVLIKQNTTCSSPSGKAELFCMSSHCCS